MRPTRDELYGIAGRAAGEAALEHGRDGARIRLVTDAFVLSRIARAIVDVIAPRVSDDDKRALINARYAGVAAADRDHYRAAALDLAKWTQHRSGCARVTEAGDCSCGLQEAWNAITE
jgi:hypothetical protein